MQLSVDATKGQVGGACGCVCVHWGAVGWLRVEVVVTVWLPGDVAWMAIDEWMDLCVAANFFTTESGRTEREGRLAYVASMITVANEVKTDRHKRMTFEEFLEAVCDAVPLAPAAAVQSKRTLGFVFATQLVRLAWDDQRPGALAQRVQRMLDALYELCRYLLENAS